MSTKTKQTPGATVLRDGVWYYGAGDVWMRLVRTPAEVASAIHDLRLVDVERRLNSARDEFGVTLGPGVGLHLAG